MQVKEIRLKIVGLPWRRTSVPIGMDREKYQKILWLRDSASESDVKNKIRELFDWNSKDDIEFMYASGRHLRPATLQDVENATSWDFGTIRALMGSGCLYVTKNDISDGSSDEGESKEAIPSSPVSMLSVYITGCGLS